MRSAFFCLTYYYAQRIVLSINRAPSQSTGQPDKEMKMATKKRTNLDIEECHRLFTYDPSTGHLIHNQGWRAGKVAGCTDTRGYRMVCVHGSSWRAHVVILAMRDGFVDPRVIDHINHNEADNRYENLRHVSHSENVLNRRPGAKLGRPHPSNRTIVDELKTFRRVTATMCSLRGVYYSRGKRAWRVSIRNRGPKIMLGSFKTSLDAIRAYDAAAAKILNGTL